MAEEEQTLDLTTIGNDSESNIEGSIEENNEEERLAAEAAAKAEEERLAAEAAAKAEEERGAAEEEGEEAGEEEDVDEGVLTYNRIMLIKHQGARIYDRDKKVILENVSSEGLFQINNAPTEGRKINLMRKFINNSMVGK